MERLRNRNKSGVRRGMKRYAARKNRSSLRGRYYLSNDIMRAKVEVYDQVYVANASYQTIFAGANQQYMNIATMLSNSISFTDQYQLWARYKITGLQITASCCSSADTIDAAFSTGAPTVSFAFYPNLTSQNIGGNPSYNDHKMLADPHVTTPQVKYWKFPEQYFEGAGFGFGIWSQCNGFTGQIGQVSACFNINTPATANIYMFNVRFVLYVLFSDKNK